METQREEALATQDDPRWRAVATRDRAADGTFYYSVRTTGVYCRPSCAARPARPENVRFHATPEAARRAGFRPCKRCRPDQAPAAAPTEIRYAVRESTVGLVLVAASPAGVCAVLLGDEPGALRTDLEARFPGARLLAGDAPLEELADRVVAFVEAPSDSPDVPLDLRGTPFQQTVWRALREVPAGATTSYVAIARRIGRPTSARAVGQAVAANPLAVLVPCHRVLRNDGALSGYRWGVERKRALLEREGAA